MSYDIQIEPCVNGRYGVGRDTGAASGKFWTVFRRDQSAWAPVTRYNAKETAWSEANRRDAIEVANG
jgi:hypothetical protein